MKAIRSLVMAFLTALVAVSDTLGRTSYLQIFQNSRQNVGVSRSVVVEPPLSIHETCLELCRKVGDGMM